MRLQFIITALYDNERFEETWNEVESSVNSPDMRDKIQKVMRYSGPRIIIYHPLLCLRHVITGAKEKRRTRRD